MANKELSMAVTKIRPNPTVLLWAAKRAGVGPRPPGLDEWLSGTAQPTLRQLEDFADAASVPLGCLFLSKPPVDRSPIPHFRTLGPRPEERVNPVLLATIHIMQQRQAWLREYLIEQGHEPLPFVRSVSIQENPSEVVMRMRVVLSIDQNRAASQQTWTDTLRVLQRQAESAGILVIRDSAVDYNARRKLDVEECRGFVLVDEYAPLVFVNAADGEDAQLLTLAHGLAHVWLGCSASFALLNLHPACDKTEQACDQIAAEFFVPANSMLNFWHNVGGHAARLELAAQQFKVSVVVAARRALDLGLISGDEFFNVYREYQERERIRSDSKERVDFYAAQNLRLGRRFGQAVVNAVREGRLLYNEAYRLTGLYGMDFERYAKLAARDQ